MSNAEFQYWAVYFERSSVGLRPTSAIAIDCISHFSLYFCRSARTGYLFRTSTERGIGATAPRSYLGLGSELKAMSGDQERGHVDVGERSSELDAMGWLKLHFAWGVHTVHWRSYLASDSSASTSSLRPCAQDIQRICRP